jgi:hypothetical protein
LDLKKLIPNFLFKTTAVNRMDKNQIYLKFMVMGFLNEMIGEMHKFFSCYGCNVDP